jgi:hydroxyacylglutathione hydrolase
MSPYALIQLPVLKDNYIYLLRDHAAEVTLAVDPAAAAPVLEALAARGWGLDALLITHHHGDHIGGNRELKQRTGCRIFGYAPDAARIPGLDAPLEDGAEASLGTLTLRLIAVPGHTLGHVAYFIPQIPLLFCGDTIFSLGCGRLFEGTPEQMFASLRRLAELPDETLLCPAHEYTEANARFALSVMPEHKALQARVAEVAALRRACLPTVPVPLAREKATNPFLRAASVEAFADLRRRKDDF